MRKITNRAVLTAFLFMLLAVWGCDDEQRISYGRLPSAARLFIETFFPGESCVYAERDSDDGRREYEARLSNGAELKFDAQGQWLEVDCKFSLLPAGIAPQAIVDDLAVRYPGAGIYKIERALGGYEISIGSGLELVYSADGIFVREDRY